MVSRVQAFARPMLVACLGFGVLAGCASMPSTAEVEMAPGADVRTYPSFAFYEPLDLEQAGFGTAAGEQARAVLRGAMEARGYRLDPETPALRLNVLGVATGPGRESPQISLGLGFGQGSAHGGVGLGLPLGPRESGPPRRLPSALTVDVVDVAARRVVWTGSISLDRVGRGGERAALEAALLRVMAGLPPRAAAD